jgi:anti-anti-sigma factor
VEESLFMKEAESILYLRARGHITAVLCSDLKSRVFQRLEREPIPAGVLLDLSECSYMDSTFMGLIVGINKSFQKRTGKRLVVVRPTKTCLDLLKNLGVLRLVEATQEALPFPAAMDDVGIKQKATAEFLLGAHEDLMDISEENKGRFQVLRTVLKSRLEEGGTEAGER